MTRRGFLPVCLLLVFSATVGAAPADSRFDRTIIALQSSPAQWRADFASIALAQLAEACIAEADLARSEPSGSEPKQARWSRGVERYADKLIFLQANIEYGMPVSFTLSPLTEATVEIAGNRVILTHPRPAQQEAFEQLVLEQFCQQRDCSLLTEPDVKAAPVSTTATINPRWAFTVDGAECAYGGIHLVFQPNDDPGELRQVCMALFREAIALLNGMREQQSYGVRIDWQQLSLSALPQQSQQMLHLNTAGDILLLDLPLVHRSPGLLTALQPWLRARLAGKDHELSLRADRFAWQGED